MRSHRCLLSIPIRVPSPPSCALHAEHCPSPSPGPRPSPGPILPPNAQCPDPSSLSYRHPSLGPQDSEGGLHFDPHAELFQEKTFPILRCQSPFQSLQHFLALLPCGTLTIPVTRVSKTKVGQAGTVCTNIALSEATLVVQAPTGPVLGTKVAKSPSWWGLIPPM